MSVSGTAHEIVDLSLEPGELSFTARIGGEQRVWLRTDSDIVPTADGALAASLLPAMRFGGTLNLPGPVSPRVLRTQREFQAVQRAWSRGWGLDEPPLEEVEVIAPTRLPDPRPKAAGRVAAFFSGGVDSWATVLDTPELTDLIFIRGFDLLPNLAQHAELTDVVEARLREAADELGLTFHVVETNLRELSDPLVGWEAYCGCALDAVALFLAPLFERILISSDIDHEVQVPMGTSRMVDHLWSTERLELMQAGGAYDRVERVRRIAGHPVVQRTLRVCWENRDGAYNCGRCRKCLITMLALEALGVRKPMRTFPPDLDLGALASEELTQPIQLVLWEDLLDTIRAAGRVDLEPAVAALVASGKRNLGLPPDHRCRSSRGPSPLHPAPPTLEALLASRSWKLTAPLRRIAASLRRLRGNRPV